MKLFIKKILLFILPIIIFVISIDSYLRNINSLYQEKNITLKKNADKIEVLILGNSHANYGINPKFFNLYAFNTANLGQSIYFDKEITIRNLDLMKKLKYVLISLDYHSLYFSKQRGERNIWSYYGNGIKYPNENYFKANLSPLIFGYSPLISYSLIKKDLKSRWNRKKFNNYINFDTEAGVDKKDTLIQGFIGFTGTEEKSFNLNWYKNRISNFNKLITQSNEKKIVLDEINQLISTLKNNNITPIFFSTPTYKDYNLILDKSIIFQNDSIIKKICKENNIEFWDYAINNNFKKSDFFNPDHLNKKGAKKFSKLINKKLNDYKIN